MTHPTIKALTPASLRTVLKIAKHSPEQAAYVAMVRAENPHSRAIDVYRNAGGGSRRRYECPLSGAVIDTESANYPMTKHAREAIDEHRASCYADLDPALVSEIARRSAIGSVCKRSIVYAPRGFTTCA